MFLDSFWIYSEYLKIGRAAQRERSRRRLGRHPGGRPGPKTSQRALRDILMSRGKTLSFLSLFFGKGQGKPPKKQGFFKATEPLKSLEKKRKTVKKTRKSSQGKKNKEIQKNKERKDRELSPHCLETIFDSQLPSPKSSPKCLPNCVSPTGEGIFSSFKITPAVRVTARQLRDKNCLGAIFAPGHQDVSQGPLGSPNRSERRKNKFFFTRMSMTRRRRRP